MGELWRIALLLLLTLAIATAALYLYLSSSGPQEVVLELESSLFTAIEFTCPNGTLLQLESSGLYVLQHGFNLSRLYVSLWLKPRESPPAHFLYAQRSYVVPHVLLPSGEELVLIDLILSPWDSGRVLETVLGGADSMYKIESTLDIQDRIGDPLRPLQAEVRLAPLTSLSSLLRNLTGTHANFTLKLYMPSTITLLSEEPVTLNYDPLVAQLEFTRVGEDRWLLNATLASGESLGSFHLTYDARRLDSYHILARIFTVLKLASPSLAAIIGAAAILRALGPRRGLLVIGSALMIAAAILDFTWHVEGRGHIYLFSYAYLAGEDSGYPLEVIYHASRAAERGARVMWPELSRLVALSLVGYSFPLLSRHQVCGILHVTLRVESGSGEATQANYTHLSYTIYEGSGAWRTVTSVVSLGSGAARMCASIKAAWGGASTLGGGLREELKLWEVKYRLEGGHIVLEDYLLPVAYKLHRLNVREFFEYWELRYILLIAGSALTTGAIAAELARARASMREELSPH